MNILFNFIETLMVFWVIRTLKLIVYTYLKQSFFTFSGLDYKQSPFHFEWSQQLVPKACVHCVQLQQRINTEVIVTHKC